MASETPSSRSEQSVEVKFVGMEAVEIYRHQIAQAAQLRTQSEAIEALAGRLAETAKALGEVAGKVQTLAAAQEIIAGEQKAQAGTQQAILTRVEATLASVQRQLGALGEQQTRTPPISQGAGLNTSISSASGEPKPDVPSEAPNGATRGWGRGLGAFMIAVMAALAGLTYLSRTG
ncbi:MAG: hypothetical protein ACAH24_23810 [Hyphomicrobiaceae bacterium]|jgi:hypothetical protein